MSNQTIFGENVEEMSVAELFERKNDPSCVEELVRRYIPKVWKKAVEISSNREEYEELYSCLLEVLMKCIRKWEGSQEQKMIYHGFVTFLYLKMDNFVRVRWKTKVRDEDEWKAGLYSRIPYESVELDNLLVEDDLREALYWGLMQLKERYRNVIITRYFYGKSLEETGEIFGVTRERIRQIEAKSMRILRSRFGRKKIRLEDYILG